MSDVSTRLKRAREQAGLQIEEVSARTKIKPAFLRAIENGHFEALPGAFFTRQFVKTYAREVGLPPEEVVRDFDLSHGSIAPDVVQNVVAAAPNQQREPRRVSSGWQVAAVAGIALVVLAVTSRPDPPTSEAVPVGTSGVAAAPAVQAPSEQQTVAEPVPDRLTIEIRPSDVVWVAATADGRPAVFKLLQPGQQVTINGREFAFRIGNAGAFDYSINGRRGKAVGGPGEVREFQITTANYRSFAQ